VLKFNQKLKSAAAYLVLISYIIIISINILHYHRFDLEKSQSILNQSDANQSIHFFIDGVVDFCPVQTAYNALQNTIISFCHPFQNYEKRIDVIDILIVSAKPLKAIILHYSLRAPPQIT
jgi:hypothetical protein